MLTKTHRLVLVLEEWTVKDNQIVFDFVKCLFRSCVAEDGSGNIFIAKLLENQLVASEVEGGRVKLRVRMTVWINERPKFQEDEEEEERAESDALMRILGLEEDGLLSGVDRDEQCRLARRQLLKKRAGFLDDYKNKIGRELSVVCALSEMVKELQDEEDLV